MTEDSVAAVPDDPVGTSDPGRPSSIDPPSSTATAGLLAALSGLPLPEHPDVYEQVHSELRRALADVDDA